MPDATAPIGVFDSGVGGLTVLSALVRALPHEDFLYVGDTARVPYGGKPPAMVRTFAFELAEALLARGVKAIVVACNTASAVALPELAAALPVPTWGVVAPGVAAALVAHGATMAVAAAPGASDPRAPAPAPDVPTRRGTVGVIGTSATVAAGTYQRALEGRGLTVWARACPLFVPIVEEGVADTEIARLVAEHYLGDRPADLRTLILGCTHYPALAPTLRTVLGPAVTLVDSATATAAVVARELRAAGLTRSEGTGHVRHLVTGDPRAYAHVAAVLGGPPGAVEALALTAASVAPATAQVAP